MEPILVSLTSSSVSLVFFGNCSSCSNAGKDAPRQSGRSHSWICGSRSSGRSWSSCLLTTCSHILVF